MNNSYTEFTLPQLRRLFETISGSWNGEDENFTADGEPYHEDHATAATEIVTAIDALQTMLNEFVEL